MNISELVESIAIERCLSKEIVIKAIEDIISEIAVKKFGNEDLIQTKIHLNGSFEVFIEQEVIEEKYDDDDFSTISLQKAQKRNIAAKCGDIVKEVLPLLLGKSEIESMLFHLKSQLNKVQKENEYNAFKDKVGTAVTGYIKRAEVNEAILTFPDGEGSLRKGDMLETDILKAGNYIKVFIKDVKESPGRQLFLSRKHDDFIRELMKNEVPEIKEGVIEVKAIARDAGSAAKVAVSSSRVSIDPVRVCIGEYGSRIQEVSKELGGEKINLIEYSENIAQLIANALAPATVLRINDKGNGRYTAIVAQDQFSKAMGRGGQNVILAKRLCKVSSIKLLTETEEAQLYQELLQIQLKALTEKLDIEEMMAHLLISSNFNTIDKVAKADIATLSELEGLDEETSAILQERAIDCRKIEATAIQNILKESGKNLSLFNVESLSLEHIKILIENKICEKTDIAMLKPKELELIFTNNDELNLSFSQASDIISDAKGITRRSE